MRLILKKSNMSEITIARDILSVVPDSVVFDNRESITFDLAVLCSNYSYLATTEVELNIPSSDHFNKLMKSWENRNNIDIKWETSDTIFKFKNMKFESIGRSLYQSSLPDIIILTIRFMHSNGKEEDND